MAARNALIREANTSNVSLYILNAEGLKPTDDIDKPYPVEGSGTDLANMYWVARETGGRLMPGNSAERSMRQFDDSSSNFYSLAYRAPHPDDERYHHIAVRLKGRPRYELQYRDGYAAVSRDVQIFRSLLTPMSAMLQSSSIPLTATTGTVTSSSEGTIVPIKARVPLKDLQFVPDARGWRALVDVYVSIFDAAGRNLTVRRFTTSATAPSATSEGDLIHDATVTLKSGTPHTIIVAVRDQTSDAVGMYRQTVGF
jgi:hypothetical protein